MKGRIVKIKIVLGADSLEVEAEKSLADLKPLIDAWYAAVAHEPLTQAQVDQWTARVAASTDKVQAAVGKSPSS